MRKKVYMFSEAIFMNPYQEENDVMSCLQTMLYSYMVEASGIADVSGDGNLGADDPQFILIYFVQKEVSHMENVSWKEITGNEKAPF